MPEQQLTKEQLLNLLEIDTESFKDPMHIVYLAKLNKMQDKEIEELRLLTKAQTEVMKLLGKKINQLIDNVENLASRNELHEEKINELIGALT